MQVISPKKNVNVPRVLNKLNNKFVWCIKALWQDKNGRQPRRSRDHAAQQLPLVSARSHGALSLGDGRGMAGDHVLDPGH